MSRVLFSQPNSAHHDVSASGPMLGPQGFQATIHHLAGVADGELEAKNPESHFGAKNLCSQIQFSFQISSLKDFQNSQRISFQIYLALKITEMSAVL